MTAKYLKEEAEQGRTLSEALQCKEPEYHFTGEKFRQFCEQLCREQRKISAEKYKWTSMIFEIYIFNEIINAKMPEL